MNAPLIYFGVFVIGVGLLSTWFSGKKRYAGFCFAAYALTLFLYLAPIELFQ